MVDTRSRVLLVEDSPADAELVREMLDEPGTPAVEVVHVERLDDACRALEDETPTCVLLDLSLPDASGLEGVREVRSIAPNVPIVVLTGHDAETVALAALAAGAEDYLHKGQVDGAAVRRAIRYAVERKRSEESDRMLRAVVDNWPAAVYVRGLDLGYRLVNREFEALFGREERQDPDDAWVLESGEVVRREEVVPSTEGPRTFLSLKFPLLDAHRRPYAVCGVSTDISDRVRVEAEKDRLAARLRQVERLESVGQLAGGVAHDFNNLLAVILNYAEFLARQLEDRFELLADVEEISRAAERGVALTRQLLIFSRREAAAPEAIDVNDLVTCARPLLDRAAGEAVELVTALDAVPARVLADGGRLEQALLNLVVNARDAMPDGGKLTISTATVRVDRPYTCSHGELPEGTYLRLAVTDTGVGMPADVAARAFDPFFTTKGAGEGTGLGLATVYGIVGEAGGTIHLYSEPGQGTSVKVHLPLTDVRPPAPCTASAEEVPRGSGQRVLVVEDERPVRELAVRILEEQGYYVIEASSPAAAIDLAERRRPDVLLSDVIMPRVSGPDLAARLRVDRPGLPIVFMSGYTDRPVALDGATLLEKPFSAAELACAIHRALLGEPAGAVQ
jgi:signal transduction histidine kinase